MEVDRPCCACVSCAIVAGRLACGCGFDVALRLVACCCVVSILSPAAAAHSRESSHARPRSPQHTTATTHFPSP